jgi:hypothetical protein
VRSKQPPNMEQLVAEVTSALTSKAEIPSLQYLSLIRNYRTARRRVASAE